MEKNVKKLRFTDPFTLRLKTTERRFEFQLQHRSIEIYLKIR